MIYNELWTIDVRVPAIRTAYETWTDFVNHHLVYVGRPSAEKDA
jgi:hypothetical protein